VLPDDDVTVNEINVVARRVRDRGQPLDIPRLAAV
jgi:hypothetical protein